MTITLKLIVQLAVILCLNAARLLADDQVTCLDGSICPDGNTCCAKSAGTGYGCCPRTNAVCCSDKTHCCPHGTECNPIDGTCDPLTQGTQLVFLNKLLLPIKTRQTPIVAQVGLPESSGKALSLAVSKLASEPGTEVDSTRVWCDHYYYCPDGYICCWYGVWLCCPSPCICEQMGKGISTQLEFLNKLRLPDKTDRTPIVAQGPESSGKVLSLAVSQPAAESGTEVDSTTVWCRDGKHYCNDGYTCCQTPGGVYTCCPTVGGNCCKDGLHCCRHGQTCVNNKCYSKDSRITFLSIVSSNSGPVNV